jgi:ferredoxin
MIITKPRDWARVRASLESIGAKRVFIMGCGECATQSHTGGEPEILATKARLEMNGYEVTGWTIGQVTCNDNATKSDLKKSHGSAEEADAVLVLSCGSGVQSVADAMPAKPVLPGLESAFLGNIVRAGVFEERCSMCGDCVLDRTAGICPVTTCPKGLLNGPCGGMWNGTCEVMDRPCVFVRIHERLREQGRAPGADTIPPRNHGAKLKPGRVDVRERERAEKQGAS